MIHQNSLRFYNDLAYDTYQGLVLDQLEGDRLASGHSLHLFLQEVTTSCTFSSIQDTF